MSVRRALRAAFPLLVLLAGQARAEPKVLRAPVYVSPGQIWVGAGGEPQGVRVKVMKELNARLAKDGIALKYVVPEGQISIKQAMQDVVDGKYEAYFGLIYSKAREDEGLVFGKEEIYAIPTVVWTRADRPIKYAGPSSLKGKKVGLVAGYPFLDDVKDPEIHVDRTAADDEANVKRLLDGQVDVIIDNLTRTGTAVLKLNAAGKVTFAKEAFESSKFVIAYHRKVPPEVIAKVDAALKAMRESGEIKRILEEAVYGPLRK